MKRIVAHIVVHKDAPERGRQSGQGLVEYMIMLALIAVAVILIINVLEPTIANVFSRFVRQAPVAPPALLAYTPPATPIPTADPNATPTNTPPVPPPDTPTPTNTPTSTPTSTPTTTASPTPPTPVASTFTSIAAEDGYVLEQASSSRGGEAFSAGAIEIGDHNNNQDSQKKGFLSFDTSTLPPEATIISAQLRIRRINLEGNPYGTLAYIVADIAQPNGFSANHALQTTDFEAGAAEQTIAIFSQAGSNGAWAEAPLLLHGLPHINRTGRTQFRLYFSISDNDNASHDRVFFDGGEAADSNNRPQLIITYTAP